MKLVAITGSIGCGKTTLAKIVKSLGYTVYDVDGWVRRFYFHKNFIKVIEQHFPEVVHENHVDKRALRNIVFSDKEKLEELESLIHPFLKEELKENIRKNAGKDDLFFLDVALLFEQGWDKYCDFIIVAHVDYETQKKRVMLRDNVSAEDFDKINNVQLSNESKMLLSDVVIETNRTKNLLKVELINIIQGIENCLA